MSTNSLPSNPNRDENAALNNSNTPQQKQQKHQSQSSETTSTGTHELAMAVDELLDQLQHKFDGVSSEIFGKLDDMGRRLDELEASLAVSGDASQTK